MVQPKTPPLSVRFGEVRLAKIDAYALKHGLKRHAAVLDLVDSGLVAMGPGLPTPERQAAIKRAVVDAQAIQRTVALPPSHKMSETKPVAFRPRVDTYPDWMRPTPKVKK